MKFAVTYIMSILMIASAFGQTPYTGGHGDGFSVSEVVFEAVGISSFELDPVALFPNPAHPGALISFQIDDEVAGVEAHSMNGSIFSIAPIQAGSKLWRLPEIPAGLYAIRIIGLSGEVYLGKLIISGL